MKKIVCHVNMFDLYQKVYVIDTNNKPVQLLGEVTVKQLHELIVQSCHCNNTNQVHLYGQDSYLEMIIQGIHTYHNTNYSNDQNIIVEVN